MSDFSLLTGIVGVAVLVLGICIGHFGWGTRWLGVFGRPSNKLHPDYLTGLDYLVTEQPDRALDLFLKLMDASSDTIETHFALGTLYRRRGEVERAIRIHQNVLARVGLPAAHHEQALLALAQDYLRAGVLDRAEALFQQVSEVPRLRATALDALRGVYELQRDWQQALAMHRLLTAIRTAPPPGVAAHYLCELAAAAIGCQDVTAARALLAEANREVAPFARATLLRARLAEMQHDREAALHLLRDALREAPQLLHAELVHLLELAGPHRSAVLGELVIEATARGPDDLKRLVFATMALGLAEAPVLRTAIDQVFAAHVTLRAVWQTGVHRDGRDNGAQRVAAEVGALLAHADTYRCGECGFAGHTFYWHCPACHAWESFETHASIKLR